ncbi:DUF4181 domain-containing protein [Priestia megaterium]|uniref:DUF4181 domain-containing protein n=1 Tax=Priestia megaterium TaxID=1404 RepID=UPI001EDC2490|nr:DUF4181 domain-containing protein [Priestia megaterium]MDH3157083.1 DUF4181 domain-containing protein [Priestia megaterium]MED4112517.1 DUF4181 domain-containing protein [Priestia megaterium]UKJ79262.1 DUF4181 domain-containing protein [Priestia megaterium]
MTLVYLLILAVVYIFLDLVMRKKLHTKMKKSYWRSFEGRRPLFITIEMVLLASFLVLIFVMPPAYTSVFMFLFLFLLYVLRGFEEWKFERNQKEHYHSWLGATFFMFASFLVLMRDM